jgi:sugar/nucleoside kinase (ribokinase family)
MGRRRVSVLFAGDANIDFQMTGLRSLPVTDREVLCDGFTTAIGGSTTIAAAAYAALGGRAAFCGTIGGDENGRILERMLRSAGVDLSLLRITGERATGVTVNLVHGATRTQVTFPGTLPLVDETDAIIRELGRFSHVHISGVYTLDRFLPRIREVLQRAVKRGITCSLDTQWDSSLQWRHLDEWLPLLSWLFVNEDEARAITGQARMEDAHAALSALTACPIVKRGAAGVFARGRGYPGFPAEVRDTTGAGDTFAAAFLFAVKEKGMGFDEAIRFGCAAGALCCAFEGGVSPALTFDRVNAFMSPHGSPDA